MINRLGVHGFKRFEELSLDFGQLNILTGLNGSGKSTVMQSLNLINAASMSTTGDVLLSSENGLGLGRASDLLNINSVDNQFSLEIGNGRDYRWTFDAEGSANGPYVKLLAGPIRAPLPFGPNGGYTYLSAERLGPRTTHLVAPVDPSKPTIGVDGRYVAHALSVSERLEIAENLRHPTAGAISTLRAQAEAWMGELVGETLLEVTPLANTNLVTLRIRKPQFSSDWVIPENTGFGVSYCLPIVVAGLLSQPGEMLVVDGPEAHLHPAGQSAIGRFLAMVADSGVQVVLETHSDHVINGIRRFVSSKKHSSLDTAFFFFDRSGVDHISIDEKGKLSHWPKGFFDQMNSDLFAISRAGR